MQILHRVPVYIDAEESRLKLLLARFGEILRKNSHHRINFSVQYAVG